MSKFDMIIGYSAEKKELRQIADTLKNRESYEKLGVSAPRGLLLYGEPGVGKSLMASAVIEASGRQVFVCRKDQPNGDFVKHIKETFDKAIENAPAIVLLDDMDKFANGDERHPDAEEYVTVQSCIDNAKGKEVFVLATVNNMRCLPKSLHRAGRFDRVIEIETPRGNDALAIISHYLKNKKVVADVDNYMFYHQSSVDLEFEGRAKALYMVSGSQKLTEFIDLHKGKEALSLPDVGEAVLSVGVCENLGIEIGDKLTLRNADLQEMEVTVSAIYDNYVENFALVHPDTITNNWGEAPEEQMAFVRVTPQQDVYAVSAAISELDSVLNVSVSEDLAAMISSMMDALDLVIILVVVCAGLLAVIVLYNLTNININERIREIATIKVLGFRASETGAYVFKENLILTVVGSILGLGLGWLLLSFVISQIKIDMVWFKATAEPLSYLLSVGLTLISALIVDFIFYFKLDKINMAEALKSVE